MCIVSNVHDHFNPLFPPHVPPIDTQTSQTFDLSKLWPQHPAPDLTEMRKLIEEFKEAVAAAQKLDVLLKKPDCVDPDKAKLQERVERLERIIDALLSRSSP